jgi:predicted amidohydrolase
MRLILLATSALAVGSMAAATPAPEETPIPQGLPHGAGVESPGEKPPRKVLVASEVSGYPLFLEPLERRLDRMDALLERISLQAGRDYPEKRLDLVVLTEYFLANPGTSAAVQAIDLGQVQPRISACARRHGCYLVVPMILKEPGPPLHYSNAAVLLDREGRLMGMYRKVHPVAAQGSETLEGGLTPGGDFPVFACDFGRLGIQICFDMLYEDGWKALAKGGAEIVALPSASPETIRPSAYAREYRYYILSSTPRDHAACFSPLGMIDSEATHEGDILISEIDLSYEILHWEAELEEGEALRRKFGSRVGFHYYHAEDRGIFWSNDPTTPIAAMVRSLGLVDENAKIDRVRILEDSIRGGPPTVP